MFCSTMNDWIAALLAVRSDMLRKAILQLLGNAAQQFYGHPMIQALMHEGEHPEYVAAGAFAKVVMDLATPKQPGSIGFEDLERGISTDLPEGPLRSSLLAILQGTEKRMDPHSAPSKNGSMTPWTASHAATRSARNGRRP